MTISQSLALAVQHHEAKRLDAAETLYRGILLLEPQHPHALHLLGVLAHQRGQLQEALGLICQALTAHGPHPVFYSNLASVLLAAGRLDEAEANCREALRLMPDLSDAHFNLGAVLKKQGRRAEAEVAFAEAKRIRSMPARRKQSGGSEAAALLVGSRDPLPAVLARLRDAVRLNPNSAHAQHELGIVLAASGQFAEAAGVFREAIRLKPDHADAHSDLGAALSDLNQVDAAMECFREALRMDPGHIRARNNLAATLQFRGRTSEALAEYQEALRLDPNDTQALFALSRMAAVGSYCFDDKEIRHLQELAERPGLHLDEVCRIHFSLAQVFDQRGAFEEAFAHCRRANETRSEINRRSGIHFDRKTHRQHVDRLIGVFTPEYFERVAGDGLDSELPIFIVGMMRSGTSLAEQILASHPRVHGAGELLEIAQLVDRLPQMPALGEPYPECLARQQPGCSEAAGLLRSLAEEHLRMLRQRGGDATRVVDKFPLNFMHLGLIATLFPRARIVHCRRDPIDTCLSCYFQNFADPFPFKQDLGNLGAYYGEYERLMAHWAHVLPTPIFDLRYEELTADPEGVSRRLLAYCELEWDERCLRFNETERPVRTASALQVRKPMYRSAVGRWKRYETQVQPLIEALRNANL